MTISAENTRNAAIHASGAATSDSVEFDKFSKRVLALVNNSMQAEAYKNGEKNDFGFEIVDLLPSDLEEMSRLEQLGTPVNITTPAIATGPILSPKHDSVFEDARRELQKLKDEFGGSPNFGNNMPTKDYANEGRILGIWPKEAGRIWATAGLGRVESGELPSIVAPFFKFVQKILGVEHKPSAFEYMSLHLESMAKLEANKATIIDAYANGVDATHRLGDVTGWAYHVDHTSFKAAGSFFEGHLAIFSELYLEHKQAGDLKEFFAAAFDPSIVCIDARHMRLQALKADAILGAVEVSIDLKHTEFKTLISNLTGDVQKKYGLPTNEPVPLNRICDYLKDNFKDGGPIGCEGLFEDGLRTITEADFLTSLEGAIDEDFTVAENDSEPLGTKVAVVDYFRQHQAVDTTIPLLKV